MNPYEKIFLSIKHYAFQLMILSFLVGCKIDFGDKALNYVNGDLNKDSRDITDRDLKVRFDNSLRVGQGELQFHADKLIPSIKEFSDLWKKTESLIQDQNKEEDKAKIRLYFAKKSWPLLMDMKRKLEILENRISFLKSMCTPQSINSDALPYIGSIGPLSSFMEMNKMAEAFQTQAKVGLILTNDSQSVGNYVDGSASSVIAGSATIATYIFSGGLSSVATGLIFSGVYSLSEGISQIIVREKINDQKKKLSQTCSLFIRHQKL